MPINIEEKLSPGWWMDRLFKKLADTQRAARLEDLHQRYRGNPPLPEANDNARDLFLAFQKKARTNYAQLAVAAVAERMSPVGFRTAADNDETGDEMAREVWDRARMAVIAADTHDRLLNLSESYVMVGFMDDKRGVPLVTAEDPRYCVGEPDPMDPYRLRAFLKYMRDDVEGEDRAYLHLPGEVWVARHESPYALLRPDQMPGYWSPESWEWSEERSGTLGHDEMAVVPFWNKDMMGEYEAHIDILDRINYQTLTRLCTAALQAFKQRAIESDPEHPIADTDDDDQPIDYDKVFTSDPAAVWLLPPGAKIWESSTADLRQILEVTKDDVLQFAATSRTPMYYLNPGGANQSADGAAMQRESLLFKVKDRIDRCSPQWAQVMRLIFLAMGEESRADLSKIQTLWASPARLSLAEKASAASMLREIFPWRGLMREIFDMDPGSIDRMESELEEEQLKKQQQALLLQQAMTAAGANNTPDKQNQAADDDEEDDAGDGNPLNGNVSGLGGGGGATTSGRVPAALAR